MSDNNEHHYSGTCTKSAELFLLDFERNNLAILDLNSKRGVGNLGEKTPRKARYKVV